MTVILKDKMPVGQSLKAMDVKMIDLTMETKLIQAELSFFHDKVKGLAHRLSSLESRVKLLLALDQEFRALHDRIIYLEDQSHRDNVRFLSVSCTLTDHSTLWVLADLV
ncbi:hypothetical protein NDU88_001512 [Pleurodeles waltl]|uniref:Uncharacterized protein n=1 Tax=Pleurodeles waltl TaxID=8319 RepID=A0AAV7LLQ5_PLEWA|nr:hypothetical protein NDU88_001512 [Pleurodeles waltl]